MMDMEILMWTGLIIVLLFISALADDVD